MTRTQWTVILGLTAASTLIGLLIAGDSRQAAATRAHAIPSGLGNK